jgi:hypothetical protein
MNQDPKQLLAKWSPKPLKVVQTEQQFCTARFSPCGKFLVAGSFEGQVARWDVTGEQPTPLPPLQGHNGFVTGVVFHGDGKRLFTSDSSGRLRAWPLDVSRSVPNRESAAQVIWDVAAAHDGWIRQLALSPDGKQLATCGRDRTVRLWNADNGQKAAEFDAGEDVYSVAFTPDGKGVVSGDLKGSVKHWDQAGRKLARELDAKLLYFFERLQGVGGVRCLVFDKAGTTLAAGGGKPTTGGFVSAMPHLLLFDWSTGKIKQTVPLGAANDGFVFEAFFHADGFLMGVISGPPGAGRLFYLRPGDTQPFFTQPFANPHALSLHPTGQRLVIAATNADSAGNGAVLDKDKKYKGNFTPLHILQFAKPA